MKKENVKKGLKRYLAIILCFLLVTCYLGQVTAFAEEKTSGRTGISGYGVSVEKIVTKVNGKSLGNKSAYAPNVIFVNDVVSYKITVANDTEEALEDVIVEDYLNYGLKITGAQNPKGSTIPGGITWTVDIPANSSKIITYDAKVLTAGYLENHVVVESPYEPPLTSRPALTQIEGPTEAYCMIFATPVLSVSNYVGRKGNQSVSVDVGDTVTFTIDILYNRGEMAAAAAAMAKGEAPTEPGMTFNDKLPAGLEFVSYESSNPNCTYDPGTGDWIVPEEVFYDNYTGTLKITAKVIKSSTMTNTATASVTDSIYGYDSPLLTPYNGKAVGGEEPTTGVWSTTKSSSVKVMSSSGHEPEHTYWPDLQITKAADKADVTIGDNVTYTISIKNIGTASALNAIVSEVIPAGLLYQSDDSGGTFDKTTGKWIVGNLGVNEEKKLSIVVKTTAAGAIVNTAAAACDNLESNMANNSSNITINVKDKPVVPPEKPETPPEKPETPPEKPIPDAPPVLPKTGGTPAEVFYFTGLASIIGGLVLKRKNK